MLLEAEPLKVCSLYQIVGNVVTYSFAHHNKHGKQNPLVPIIGLSGYSGQVMVALYDAVTDVLVYTEPRVFIDPYGDYFDNVGIAIIKLPFLRTSL